MAVFNEPTKWAQTLGQDADVVSIPDTAGDTDPSIDKIFPGIFSFPLAQGGKAIPRSVLNGLFKLLGDWIYYIQNGGIAGYSNTFDYAVGSFVKYNNEFYRCIQANGVSSTVKAPTDSAYWSKITTLADVTKTFANRGLSNLSASGQDILDRKASISLSNLNDAGGIVISRNAMPSLAYDDLTLGSSGTSYTAPSNGYVYIAKDSSASGQYIEIESSGRLAFQTTSYSGGQTIRFFVPIAKGATFSVLYNLGGTTQRFRFVYAIGSISEKV